MTSYCDRKISVPVLWRGY